MIDRQKLAKALAYVFDRRPGVAQKLYLPLPELRDAIGVYDADGKIVSGLLLTPADIRRYREQAAEAARDQGATLIMLPAMAGGAGHQSPAEVMAISQGIAPIASAASTATNGAAQDMQGWGGILGVLNLGATDGTVDYKAQSDDNSGFSSATDITGAALTQISATGDNKVYGVDVWRPTERYVRDVVTTGTGATADQVGSVAMRYAGQGRFPITQTLTELIKVASN